MTSKILTAPCSPPRSRWGKGQQAGQDGQAAHVPAVVRGGRLTLQQIKRAVDTALRGQTFEADAQG